MQDHGVSPVVLISGASRGLGAATARRLASSGARLALGARSRAALESLALQGQGQGQALALEGDLTDPAVAARWVEATLARFGRLDALINNAAQVGPLGPLGEVEPGAWIEAVGLNLVAPSLLIRAALPALREAQGRIVNVGTGAAVQPLPGFSAYCATKAGLAHLTRVVAAEEPRVTCLSFSPGVIDTDMQACIRAEAPTRLPRDLGDFFLGLARGGALASPEVPARVLAWLCLEASPEWSGRELDVHGPELRGLQAP